MKNCLLYIFLFLNTNSYSQLLCKQNNISESIEDYITIQDIIDGGSLVINNLDYQAKYNYVYIIQQQSDLVYFMKTFDSDTNIVKISGYYRKKFIKNEDSEIVLRWVKDLIWNTYNENGVLQQSDFYLNGNFEKTLYKFNTKPQ